MRKMSRVDKDVKVKMILSSCECLLHWQMFNCESLYQGRALSHLTAEDCSHACVLEECTVLAGHLVATSPEQSLWVFISLPGASLNEPYSVVCCLASLLWHLALSSGACGDFQRGST